MAIFGNREYAIIYGENGEHITTIKINKKKTEFEFREQTYITDRKNVKPFVKNGFLTDKKYYNYNIDNPFPILMDKKNESLINPKQLNIMLETKVLQDLNKIDKGFFGNIKPIHIIIGIVVIIILYYLATGGSIT